MKGETLIQAVTNILFKKVTEEEAKDFALKQYGVLATYIRNKSKESVKKSGTLLVLIFILFACSCKTYYKTNYKVHTKEKNYYVNDYKLFNDSIFFAEQGRGLNNLKYYKLPYTDCEVIKNRIIK